MQASTPPCTISFPFDPQNYLVSLTNVTSIMVSHDSSFLDFCCTNILHYENRKLKIYRGNLSEFVKQKPEARSYYELSASPISFKFPEPGFLEGVKTKDKAILKMMKVGGGGCAVNMDQMALVLCVLVDWHEPRLASSCDQRGCH